MAKIIGNTTATPNPRPDWNQTDATKADFIKNKPTVDQTYSETSANAQSGKAVAEAIAGLVDAAPEALDTLNELAAALGEDPNFATTVLTEIDKKPGETTPDGGVIFNDYENNKALGKFSQASGTKTIAGCKAFTLASHNFEGSWGAEGEYKVKIESDEEKQALVDLANFIDESPEKSISYSLFLEDSTDGTNYGNFDLLGKIIRIDTSTDVIYVTNYIPNCNITNGSAFYVPEAPLIGTKVIGNYTTVNGYANVAGQICSYSEGYDNISAGKYSHTQNRGNIAGYAADAGGWNTKAIGKASITRGKDTQALIDYSDAGGQGTKTTANKNKVGQFVRGLFNIGKDETIMEIGNGTSNDERKNAFEVYRDGHAEVQKQGETDNSVVTKNGLATLTKNYIRRGETINGNSFKGVILGLDNNMNPTYGPIDERSVVNGDNVRVEKGSKNAGAFGSWGAVLQNCSNSYVFGKQVRAYRPNQVVIGGRNTVPKDASQNIVDDGAILVVADGDVVGWDRDAFKVFNDGSATLRTVGNTDNSVVNKGYVDTQVNTTKKYVDDAIAAGGGNNIDISNKADLEIITPNAMPYDIANTGLPVSGQFTVTNIEHGFSGGGDRIHVEPKLGNNIYIIFASGAPTELEVGSVVDIEKNTADTYSKFNIVKNLKDKASKAYVDNKTFDMANQEAVIIDCEWFPEESGTYTKEHKYTVTSVTKIDEKIKVVCNNGWTIIFSELKTEIPVGAQISVDRDLGDPTRHFYLYKDVKHKADLSYVQQLEARIAALEAQLNA